MLFGLFYIRIALNIDMPLLGAGGYSFSLGGVMVSFITDSSGLGLVLSGLYALLTRSRSLSIDYASIPEL